MIDYLAMLLEEQVWEDEEETASLELPPEGGTVWKKGRAERAPEGETVAPEAADTFPAWLETERAAVQREPVWEEKEEPSAQVEEALPEGGASGEESVLEVLRSGSTSPFPRWASPRYSSGTAHRESGIYPQLKMGQAAVAYARQRGGTGGLLLSRTEPEEGAAPLPVGELDRLVERDARRYDGARPLY